MTLRATATPRPRAPTTRLSYDTVAPETTIAFSPAAPNGSNGWYKAPRRRSPSSASDRRRVSPHCLRDRRRQRRSPTADQSLRRSGGPAHRSATGRPTASASSRQAIRVGQGGHRRPGRRAVAYDVPAPVGAFLSPDNVLFFKGDATGPSPCRRPDRRHLRHRLRRPSRPPVRPAGLHRAARIRARRSQPLYKWFQNASVPGSRTVTSFDVAGNASAGATVTFARDDNLGSVASASTAVEVTSD